MNYQELLSGIDKNELIRNMNFVGSFEKLSGEEEALAFVEYVEQECKGYPVNFHREVFPAYLSNPIRSTIRIGEIEYPSRPRSFSADCRDGISGYLYYDDSNLRGSVTEKERAMHYAGMRGKIVISHGFDERYAKMVERSGALGWIQIWMSEEHVIHEDTVSPVWGTPDMDSMFMQLSIPILAVSYPTGEEIIRKIQKNQNEELTAYISTELFEGVREVELPVVDIPGKSKDFIMLSDHYDTWYKGAFDNGAANVISLEIMRRFSALKGQLKRGLRICWWPGHSNGRYMGSTWYCDNHFDEIYQHCAASLNMDLCAGIESDTLFFRTTGLEGRDFLKQAAREAGVTERIELRRITRGADQSFFGCDIPYHVNPRYEKNPQSRTTTAGAGHVWWHTAEDTLDKIDHDLLVQETKVMTVLLGHFLDDEILPIELEEYFDGLIKDLEKIGVSGGIDALAVVEEIKNKLYELKEIWLTKCQEHADDSKRINTLTKLAGGTITRLIQSSGSPYEQDTAFAYGPLHMLGAGGGVKKEECPEDIFLFYRTSMIRQRNRFLTELEKCKKLISMM